MYNKSLESVVLIDDNKVSNFFNKVMLQNMGISKHVQIFNNCLDALNFFNKSEHKTNLLDNLVFLDLHTPYMNGWEFLDKLGEMPVVEKLKVIVMHDSNILPEEEVKLYQYSFVQYITNKHLEESEVSKILVANGLSLKSTKASS